MSDVRITIRGLEPHELDAILAEITDPAEEVELVDREDKFVPDLSETEMELLFRILYDGGKAVLKRLVDSLEERGADVDTDDDDD